MSIKQLCSNCKKTCSICATICPNCGATKLTQKQELGVKITY